ncbi:hypothetical protein PLIIFM63780_000057 [Purpureocillium lilacinum]|uniref:Uncharacterized protein n=1 Tax=Purpureocillium lilacinum TaxID=33203 RepID=A0A179HET6_PURLI|nr:hypothetical protein Purlil1_12959 [Purpureocillium lilacinum]OAQ88030.1 hypothetical protein VFPBJ_02071 [Purpureocillium lilacinum]PWI66837.1 hypothetical protein PCL_04681 [Purpureocillium lilacinum]GJN69746.1 hypothetical protein PLICBS_003798 [Purpureocillium lilacinum]GJN76573.1 hypothetical protein PLIIFM63780_000057 [Purpureocillium lilacinum]
MKTVAIAIVSLASLAVAVPADNTQQCKPATYQCEPGNPSTSWDVCNTSGQWVFAGTCPPKTVCKFDAQNGSPYCVPPSYTIS